MFLSEQNIFHTGYIDMVFTFCVLSGVLIDFPSKLNICHNGCIYIASPQYVFFGDVIELLLSRTFLWYFTRSLFKEKHLSHMLQLYILPLMWARMCLVNAFINASLWTLRSEFNSVTCKYSNFPILFLCTSCNLKLISLISLATLVLTSLLMVSKLLAIVTITIHSRER